MNPRLVIDRLELDLRGVDPDVARAAARLLGPALQAALAAARLPAAGRAPVAHVDAGSVAAAGDSPQRLASALADRIAQRVRQG